MENKVDIDTEEMVEVIRNIPEQVDTYDDGMALQFSDVAFQAGTLLVQRRALFVEPHQ